MEDSYKHGAGLNSEVETSFLRTFIAKPLRTDHTSDPHFTKLPTVYNFKQPWAGLSRSLEWVTRKEKDPGVQHFRKIPGPASGYNMVKETFSY